MRHKASDSGGKLALLLLLYRHIGLLFGKRLDTNFLRHRIRKYPGSPVYTLSDSLRNYFFPFGELSGFADEFAGCVWTIAVSKKKKLWIQKYPDKCRQGLNQVRLILFGAVKAIFTRASFGQSTNYGQTDRQVVASGRKLNLRRDLRWVAKRTRKFPHKYTQVAL